MKDKSNMHPDSYINNGGNTQHDSKEGQTDRGLNSGITSEKVI